jgi:hypothetical protein
MINGFAFGQPFCREIKEILRGPGIEKPNGAAWWGPELAASGPDDHGASQHEISRRLPG